MSGVISGDYELVPVGDLVRHPENARQGDVGAVVASIEANGFYGSLVVQRSTRHVLVGNHRLEAAQHAGLEAVPVVWVDCDDDRARRILLVDNRTNDLASYDDSALVELLRGLVDTPAGLEGTGFDGDDLDDLIAQLADAEPPDSAEPEGGGDGPAVYGVAVACQSEDHREELIARLEEWGYEPRKVDGEWAAQRRA